MKAKVSRRAVEQRVNRALAKQGLKLRKSRRLAEYFIVDVSLNAIVSHDVDLETLALDHRALAGYEEIEP